MEVAVIGGGHGCYAAAAHLTEAGHRVRLWLRNDAKRAALEAAGRRITLVDFRGTRTVEIAEATADLGGAVRGAGVVVCPLPATTHESVAPLLAEVLEPGQAVFLPPGTFGSYLFAEAQHRAGRAGAMFAEAGTLPYLARMQDATTVRVSGYATRLPTGVFPEARAQEAFAALRAVYPAIEPCGDALSGALMNAGPIIHPPLILMNAGPLEHFEAWDIHNEGTQPSIRRTTDALDAERIAVREALGYGAPHFPLADHYNADGDEWMYGDAAHERLTDSGDWRELIDLTSHRYMCEDVALGLVFLVSAARTAGVAAPIAAGMVAIASAITQRDLMAEGRTLTRFGLADLGRGELKRRLSEGFQP